MEAEGRLVVAWDGLTTNGHEGTCGDDGNVLKLDCVNYKFTLKKLNYTLKTSKF